MSFKFCPECGFKFDKEYKFCPECGYKLAGATEKKPEPLFDFSDDTALYPEEVTVDIRTKRYEPIKNISDLKYIEQIENENLAKNDVQIANLHYNVPLKKKIEKELEEQFAKYFDEYCEFGPDNGITVERNVSPTYFGADARCKPIHFLFRKSGKDVLAVAIVTYWNYKHPLVKSVETACSYRKKVNYLRFFVGKPNTEHFVVRRVLEELKLIPKTKFY